MSYMLIHLHVESSAFAKAVHTSYSIWYYGTIPSVIYSILYVALHTVTDIRMYVCMYKLCIANISLYCHLFAIVCNM